MVTIRVVCGVPEGVGHRAWSALLGPFPVEGGAAEGVSNSLSSMLALFT